MHLYDIITYFKLNSDSSSTEQLAWELLSMRESPSSSRGSLDSDWLGAPLTPVSTQGPWRFETEFTDLTDDEDPLREPPAKRPRKREGLRMRDVWLFLKFQDQ